MLISLIAYIQSEL